MCPSSCATSNAKNATEAIAVASRSKKKRYSQAKAIRTVQCMDTGTRRHAPICKSSVSIRPPCWKVYLRGCLPPRFPRRILSVELRELRVQRRPVAREHGRLGEEGLAHDGEELCRVLGGVRVD